MTAKRTAPRRTRAIQTSISRSRARRGLSVGTPLLDSLNRPLRLLAQHLVAVHEERVREGGVLGVSGVTEREQRVPVQPARLVAWDVQALVALAQLVTVLLQPV